MQVLTEMDLPVLPIESPEFDASPMPFIEVARRQHPWLATFSQGYFVHGYNAIRDLTAMDENLRPSFDGVVDLYDARGTSWGDWMANHIIAISGPTHARIRDSVARGFNPRERISELLDEWAPKRTFDFSDFAALFPISVLCGLLGTSTDAIPTIHNALETQGKVFSLDPGLRSELLAGHAVMEQYVDKLVTERERDGPADGDLLLDTLIATKNEGKISEAELRSLLLVLFPAGYDTSKNMMTFLVHMLLQNPGHWERCAADLRYCTRVTEEMFRHSSISTVFRTVAQEFAYDGIWFPRDARLFFGNTLSGRDPAAFVDGDRFRPERDHAHRHLAFGRGAHICIGQHLARVQIAEGLHLVAQRLGNPRLAGEVRWRAFLGTWGPSSLPIEFDPAPAREITEIHA